MRSSSTSSVLQSCCSWSTSPDSSCPRHQSVTLPLTLSRCCLTNSTCTNRVFQAGRPCLLSTRSIALKRASSIASSAVISVKSSRNDRCRSRRWVSPSGVYLLKFHFRFVPTLLALSPCRRRHTHTHTHTYILSLSASCLFDIKLTTTLPSNLSTPFNFHVLTSGCRDCSAQVVPISARDGFGLPALRAALRDLLEQQLHRAPSSLRDGFENALLSSPT